MCPSWRERGQLIFSLQVAARHSDLIADAAMRLRRTRLDPWPFPWIQSSPEPIGDSNFGPVLLIRTAASA
jgi:hypothetical protein